MALNVADRVQETTTTTGTGTYTLAGAKDGFQSFAAVGDGNTTYYACTDGTDYEVGIGTYTASGTTLARTTIIESSNSDAAVNWGAGSKDIFVTLPASKAVVLDASGHATFSNDVIFDGSSANITFDKSQNNLKWDDGARAYFGDDADLTIYHEGVTSETRIWNSTGDLDISNLANDADITIATDDGSGGITNYFVADGSTGEAQLYHYGSEKLATQSGGIDVTGNITVSGTVDGVDIATRDGVLTTTTTTADAAMPKAGGTFTGDIAFEGSTADDFETTLTVTDPTADQTITLPDSSGTVVLLDSLGDITFETSDANKTIVFDKSADALHFKRPTGSDAYGKSPELLFNTFSSSKIFDEFTQGASNGGFNIVANTKLHFDAPNITYRDGSADGNEFLESSFIRSGTSYSWNQHHQPELNPSTHPTFCFNYYNMYTAGFAEIVYTADYGSNTTFDNNGLELVLDKEQDTVADNDDIALIIFRGNNSAGDNHEYAKITSTMQDVTDTTEDGILKFSVSSNGSFVDYFQIDGDADRTLFLKPIAFEGSTADAYETTLDVVDPTQDNTLNLPDESGTIATRAHAVALASVLG